MLNKYFRSLSLGGEKLRHIKDIFCMSTSLADVILVVC